MTAAGQSLTPTLSRIASLTEKLLMPTPPSALAAAATTLPGLPLGDAMTVRSQVRAEQVALLFRQALPNQFVTVLVAAATCIALFSVVDHRLLAGWFGVMNGIAFMRMSLILWHRESAKPTDDATLWEKRFVVTIAFSSAAWGLGGVLLMPHSVLHQVVIYFFLMGMCNGTAILYSTHSLSVRLAIFLIMLPATLYFAAQGDTIHLTLAFGAVVFTLAAGRATTLLNEFLSRSYHLAFELKRAKEAAETLARTDPLTGLNNRRAFYEMADLAVKNAARSGRSCAAVMLDIDRFKGINDTHGHATGDEVIKALSRVLKDGVREGEFSGRLGGEEFAVILPDASVTDARALAERLRAMAEAAVVRIAGKELRFTCSFGVAASADPSTTVESLLDRADGALYAAKEGGRNRVKVALPRGRRESGAVPAHTS